KASANKKGTKGIPPLIPRSKGYDRLNLAKEIGSDRRELLFVGIGIQIPQRRGDTAQERVAVLRREAGADDFLITAHRQALGYDHGLIQDSAEHSMIEVE